MERNKIQLQSVVNVQAYKHNGELYRQWNGVKVIENHPDYIVLFMYKTKVEEINGQKWVVREPILWYFPKNEWFNTTGLIRKSGTHYYTNLASPFLFEDNTIKYIDYDLDIKSYPGQKLKVVDRAEYERHSKEFQYSEKLRKIIKSTTKQLLAQASAGEDFFDEDVIDTYIKELIENKDLAKKFLQVKFD